MEAVKDFEKIKEHLRYRNESMIEALRLTTELAQGEFGQFSDKELLPSDRLAMGRLAATDLFVEKAQRVLSRRASMMSALGYMSLVMTTCVLGGSTAGALIVIHNARFDDPTTGEVILRIFQGLGLAGYLLIAMRTFIALARSFFHEATVLRDRRHAMRFGRLMVHLMGGKEMTLEDLTEAFNWNIQTSSSFLDIDANRITETVVGNLLNVKEVAEFIRSNAKLAP